MSVSRRQFLLSTLGLAGLASCAPQQPNIALPTATPNLPKSLTLYNWDGDISADVLEKFTQTYGIAVNYVSYESQQDAVANIRAGKLYDLVVLDGPLLQPLITDNLLAPLDLLDIPNFNNISANFRDLAFDPGNRHSVPFQWGTVGLLVRPDLVSAPVSQWADLWDAQFTGKVALWSLIRYVMGIALKRQGYSINSNDPAHYQAIAPELAKLRQQANAFATDSPQMAEMMSSGQYNLAFAFVGEAAIMKANNVPVDYILPKEGTIIWGDNFVVPVSSRNKYAAELLIDFILRPEISAEIVNANFYATPNEAALALVNKEVRENPWIFPPNESLLNAEILTALSPEGQAQQERLWADFIG
jgi:spermidine/putrescine transport system substrate-binding protein